MKFPDVLVTTEEEGNVAENVRNLHVVTQTERVDLLTFFP